MVQLKPDQPDQLRRHMCEIPYVDGVIVLC